MVITGNCVQGRGISELAVLSVHFSENLKIVH
jgi:hypothetical protein